MDVKHNLDGSVLMHLSNLNVVRWTLYSDVSCSIYAHVLCMEMNDDVSFLLWAAIFWVRLSKIYLRESKISCHLMSEGA